MFGEKILIGLGAGAAYGFTAWKKQPGQTFDLNQFLPTLFIGTAAGVVSEFSNVPIDDTYLFMINAGAVVLIENLLKIAWRRLTGKSAVPPATAAPTSLPAAETPKP